MAAESATPWNTRQTLTAVAVAVVIGIVGGGAIYAATDSAGPPGRFAPIDGEGPGGFGPPGPPPL